MMPLYAKGVQRSRELGDRHGGAGEGEADGRAGGVIGDPDGAAVRFDQTFADRQAKPRAFLDVRFTLDLTEGFKELGTLFEWNADALILHVELDMLVVRGDAEGDHRVGRGEFGGVMHQIRDHLTDAGGIDLKNDGEIGQVDV